MKQTIDKLREQLDNLLIETEINNNIIKELQSQKKEL